jgi:hypothetical protein
MRLLETDNRWSSTYHEPTGVLNKYGGGYGRSRRCSTKNCIRTDDDEEQRKPGKDLSGSGSSNLNSYFRTVFTLLFQILNMLFIGMRLIPISFWVLLMFGMMMCPRIVAGLPDAVDAKSKSSLLVPAVMAIVATARAAASVAGTTDPHKRKLPKRRSKALARRRKTSTFNHAAARSSLNLEPTATFQEIIGSRRPVRSEKPPSSPDKSELKAKTKIMTKDIVQLKKKITRANKDQKRDRSIIEEAGKKDHIVRKKCRTLTSEKRSLARKLTNLEHDKEKLNVHNIKSRKKINNLEEEKKVLSNLLKEEKRTSRLVIKNLMEKAETSMSDVHDLALALEQSKKDFEKETAVAKDREREAVTKERTWSARVLARC